MWPVPQAEPQKHNGAHGGWTNGMACIWLNGKCMYTNCIIECIFPDSNFLQDTVVLSMALNPQPLLVKKRFQANCLQHGYHEICRLIQGAIMHLAFKLLRFWQWIVDWLLDKVSTSHRKGPWHRLRVPKKPQEPSKQEHLYRGPCYGPLGTSGF